MEHKKLRLSVGIVFAMALLAGCSSHKADDSSKNAAPSTTSTGSSGGSFVNSGSDSVKAQSVVYFGFDKYDLTPEAQSVLDNNIASLKNGSQHIRLEGHADERGTREYNLALGERRAKSVAKYLAANGVAKARIETISYGKERPADAGHDESAWAKNRRVEIVLN